MGPCFAYLNGLHLKGFLQMEGPHTEEKDQAPLSFFGFLD